MRMEKEKYLMNREEDVHPYYIKNLTNLKTYQDAQIPEMDPEDLVQKIGKS